MKYAWLLLLAGCSSSTTVVTNDAGTPADDAGTSPIEDAGTEPPKDAGSDATTDACDATCRKNSFVATFDGAAAAFDRAQFGIETGGETRHVEAFGGGDPACPSESSPTPQRTLVFAGVGGATPKLSYFDFVGSGAPLVKAKTLTITNVVKLADVVAFDVDATFDNGTVKGHVAATLCDSLSD